MKSALSLLATSVALAATLSACAPGIGMNMDRDGSSAPMSPMAPMGMTARPDTDMQAVLDAHAALGARPIESLTVQQARTQPSPADAVNRVKMMMGMSTAPDASVTTRDLNYPTAGRPSRCVSTSPPTPRVRTCRSSSTTTAAAGSSPT